MNRIVVESGTDWLTPVATLLAVLVGGGVTWLVQWMLTKRHEESQAKASARMLQGDLAIAANWLQDMVENDHRWFSFYDLALPNWDQHAAVVARHLSSDDWEAVSQSALELAGLTAGWRMALVPDGPLEGEHVVALSQTDLASYRLMWENASKAHNTLAALAEVPPEPGLLHEGMDPHAAIARPHAAQTDAADEEG